MTVQDTIIQAKYFTKIQKQQIGYYYLLSALKEDNEQENNIMKLFDLKIDLDIPKTEKKIFERKMEKPIFGIWKDEISIFDDFNEPLEDFKNYM